MDSYKVTSYRVVTFCPEMTSYRPMPMVLLSEVASYSLIILISEMKNYGLIVLFLEVTYYGD